MGDSTSHLSKVVARRLNTIFLMQSRTCDAEKAQKKLNAAKETNCNILNSDWG